MDEISIITRSRGEVLLYKGHDTSTNIMIHDTYRHMSSFWRCVNYKKSKRDTVKINQVDGGMTSNSLVMQMQADISGINVIRAACTESTALGAALVAYWGIDRSQYPFAEPTTSGITYYPKISDDEREMRYKQWKMAVERSLGWEQN